MHLFEPTMIANAARGCCITDAGTNCWLLGLGTRSASEQASAVSCSGAEQEDRAATTADVGDGILKRLQGRAAAD